MDMDALLRFLDGSEQLELNLESLLEEPDSALLWQDCLPPESASGPKASAPRSKKAPSSQRRRNEKMLLQSEIHRLQQDLQRMHSASLRRQVHEPVNRLQLQNLRLRRLHAQERSRAETAATLLKRLASMKVNCALFSTADCRSSSRYVLRLWL